MISFQVIYSATADILYHLVYAILHMYVIFFQRKK